MRYVKPKKHLGQHFLKDDKIAQSIISAFKNGIGEAPILEIGPGTGVLTRLILQQFQNPFKVVEIDKESVQFLQEELQVPPSQIIEKDFLKLNLAEYFKDKFSIIGNFPYNISTQIFFKILEHRQQVERVTCMIQKEVADRIETKSGGRTAGILTALVQAFYNVSHEFDVPPSAFIPPPKVNSSVITLQRNNTVKLDCDEKLFFKVVKQSFAMRRKTLRNNFKIFKLPSEIVEKDIFSKRAETLSVEDFIWLTNLVRQHQNS